MVGTCQLVSNVVDTEKFGQYSKDRSCEEIFFPSLFYVYSVWNVTLDLLILPDKILVILKYILL